MLTASCGGRGRLPPQEMAPSAGGVRTPPLALVSTSWGGCDPLPRSCSGFRCPPPPQSNLRLLQTAPGIQAIHKHAHKPQGQLVKRHHTAGTAAALRNFDASTQPAQLSRGRCAPGPAPPGFNRHAQIGHAGPDFSCSLLKIGCTSTPLYTLDGRARCREDLVRLVGVEVEHRLGNLRLRSQLHSSAVRRDDERLSRGVTPCGGQHR